MTGAAQRFFETHQDLPIDPESAIRLQSIHNKLGKVLIVWRESELEVGDVILFVSRIVNGLRTTRTDTPLKVVREVSSEEYADWAVSAGITPGHWKRAVYYEVAAE